MKYDPTMATGVDMRLDFGLTTTPVAADFSLGVTYAYYKDSVTGAFANPIGAMTGIMGTAPVVLFKVG
jgi:hypothetical protein